MMAMGESGYLDHVDRAMKAAEKLKVAIAEMPQLELVSKPDMSIVVYRATKESKLNIYAIADRLEDRDWLVDRQQNPNTIHCTLTSNHLERIEEYIEDLKSAVAYLEAHPDQESRGNAAMYGMMAKVPFRGMVKQSVMEVMEKLYGPDATQADFSLSAESSDDGVLMKLVKSYGGRALSVLDRVEKLRDKLPFGARRRKQA